MQGAQVGKFAENYLKRPGKNSPGFRAGAVRRFFEEYVQILEAHIRDSDQTGFHMHAKGGVDVKGKRVYSSQNIRGRKGNLLKCIANHEYPLVAGQIDSRPSCYPLTKQRSPTSMRQSSTNSKV